MSLCRLLYRICNSFQAGPLFVIVVILLNKPRTSSDPSSMVAVEVVTTPPAADAATVTMASARELVDALVCAFCSSTARMKFDDRFNAKILRKRAKPHICPPNDSKVHLFLSLQRC